MTVSLSDQKTSLDQYALRFLYGSGEAQRILYEVAARNETAAQNPPEFFADVPTIGTIEHYRITLVPSLLLAGLISLIIAGVITAAMMACTWKQTSMQTFRRVDEVRLLVDSALHLREDQEGLLQLARCSNGDTDAWAAGYKVRYIKEDVEGMATIVLKKG